MGKLKEKNMKKIIFFASLKSLKKGVGSGVEYGSGSQNPNPHQNVTDPQHCEEVGRGAVACLGASGKLATTLPSGVRALV